LTNDGEVYWASEDQFNKQFDDQVGGVNVNTYSYGTEVRIDKGG
jgi:hypothetical protein